MDKVFHSFLGTNGAEKESSFSEAGRETGLSFQIFCELETSEV